MYGKVMSIPDKSMGQYFRLVTRWTPSQISELERDMTENRIHPRDAKMKLAREIVSIFHSEEAAAQAEQGFVRVFQHGNQPEEMPEYQRKSGQTVLEVLIEGKLVSSKNEGRRLLEQDGVHLDEQILKNPNQVFPHSGVLRVGKRRYIKVV